MPLTTRIIPILHVKPPNVVKGIHLEGLRVLGLPEDFAEFYYQAGADELIYMDTVASLYGRPSIHSVVQRTAGMCFVPITVGGGIRTVGDARELLRNGADKIACNTAALDRPQLLAELADAFGSQCVVLSVEAREQDGRWTCLTDNGRETTGRGVLEWVEEAVDLGVGEILLINVDRDGTGLGYDHSLIQAVSTLVNVPVIAAGGAGRWEDVLELLRAGVDAAAASSLFHYDAIKNIRLPSEGNVEYLMGRRGDHPSIQPIGIDGLKQKLLEESLCVRPL